MRRRYAAWTQAARVGATAGRAGAAEAEEAADGFSLARPISKVIDLDYYPGP